MEFKDSVRAILDGKGASVHSISPNRTVYEALERMSHLAVGALVVQEDEKAVGIISERDYARKIILEGRTSRDALVSDIMTQAVIVASLSDTVDDCMKLLTQHNIRHLPVVEDGKTVGMITAGDLVRWIMNRQSETIEHLEHYIASGYIR
jgi:CBS domain-containing protein